MKTLTTLLLILTSTFCFGQTKIGNITIPDSEAQRYFLDCYRHPDTVYEKTESDGVIIHWNAEHTAGYGDPESRKQSEARKQRVDAYNADLRRIAIAKYGDSIPQKWLVARKPSEIDFIKWKARTQSK